eukprot:763652-Hanusia_phi.AAC.1
MTVILWAQAACKLKLPFIRPLIPNRPLSSATSFSQELAHAMRRKNVKYFNRLIAKYAESSSPHRCIRLFQAMHEVRVTPNEHSWGGLINGHMRVGDVEGGLERLREFLHGGGQLNPVLGTNIIKGLVAAGRMEEATGFLSEMQAMNVDPNDRTFKTLLRGCLRWGRGEQAEEIYEEIKSRDMRDEASDALMIRILCQSRRLSEAEVLLGGLNGAAPVPRLAVGYALLMEGNDSKAAEQARRAMEELASAEIDEMSKLKLTADANFIQRVVVERKEGKIGSETSLRNMPRLYVSSSNNLHKRELRKTLSEMLGAMDAEKPLHVEICAGSGEWILDQASSGDANWVAVEHRFDRAHEILTKRDVLGVENLLVLNMDATLFCSDMLRSQSVTSMFLRFPEPVGPGSSFFKPSFLRAVHRSLEDKGTFHIVTDDRSDVCSPAPLFTLHRCHCLLATPPTRMPQPP